MKIIYMHCNVNKSIKKERTKSFNKLFSLKTKAKLENMNEEELNEFFANLDNTIDMKNKKDFEDFYLNYFIANKKINRSKELSMISKEIACTTTMENFENNDIQHNFANTIKKISDKLMKLMNSKLTKGIVGCAITIALTLSCYALENAVMPCATGGSVSVDNAYYYIRMISGVVAFIFMAIEIVQNAVNGDVRAIWYIVAKYVMVILAIVSFRKIFTIIDEFFNV